MLNKLTFKNLTEKNSILYSFIAFISVLHFYFIYVNSVQIPYGDEWEFLRENSFLLNPSWHSLFEQHNEHRLALTKLVFALYFKLGFDVLLLQFINFCFYVFTLIFFLRNTRGKNHAWLAFFTSFLLLSPLNFENHFWPFQIQWHLVIFFSFLSTYILTKNSRSKLDNIWAVILPFSIIYSLGSGVIAVWVLMMYLIFKNFFLKNKDSIIKDSLFAISGLAATLSYFIHYVKPPHHPKIVWPFALEFWKHFSSIVSLGSGRVSSDSFLAGVTILVYTATVVYLLIRDRVKLNFAQTFLALTAITTLGMLFTISLSRAGFGFEQALSSRYFQFSTYFFVSVLSLGFTLNSKKLRIASIALVLLVLNMTFGSYKNTEDYYSGVNTQRNRGKECVNKIIQMDTGDICADIYPSGLKEIIHHLQSKDIKLIFLKN